MTTRPETRLTRRALIGSGALALAACSSEGEGGASPVPSATTSSTSSPASPAAASSTATPKPTATSTAIPALKVETAADGLEFPWDLVFVDDAVVFTERPGRLKVLRDGQASQVEVDLDVAARGEGGLLGIEASPDFASDRRVLVCYNSTAGDVRIVPLELSDDLRRARRLEPLLAGLPANPSGRHSGCRPRLGPDGMLYVGTGDTARGPVPQDMDSLGGKVLRLRLDGSVPDDNPWADARGSRRYLWTLGHRNVQGLAVQPGTGRIYSAEHGPGIDDEVNLLARGANHGWNPVGSGTYDETVPMTDPAIKGARPAVWSSGDPTLATSGIDFVTGAAWGGYSGRLFVACLKASRMLALQLRSDGTVAGASEVPELSSYGRLRTPRLDPSGTLWVTTSSGAGDKLLRVTPA